MNIANNNNTVQVLAGFGLHLDHAGQLRGKLYFERPVYCQSWLMKENSIGAFTYTLGSGQSELWNATIGRYCSLAPGVVVGPPPHQTDHLSTHPFSFGGSSFLRRFEEFTRIESSDQKNIRGSENTVIGNDVWIGQNALDLMAESIMDGQLKKLVTDSHSVEIKNGQLSID